MVETPERIPARFKESPEDFVVDEVPAYEPSGSGEHVFVRFRKRLLTTEQAVARLARALGADDRAAGYAGMKDRVAVTTQTASFHLPIGVDAEQRLGGFRDDGVEVIWIRRSSGKLKPGHLLGNRFAVTLRGLSEAAQDEVRRGLEQARDRGVPNAFGPQRFGRDGDNPARALAWVAGDDKPPRNRRELRFVLSALQSYLFNEVLALRVQDGTWSAVLPGDVAKKHDTGGVFSVPLDGPELAGAEARAAAGSISATGPMFGAAMRWPEGAPRALEAGVLERAGLAPDRLRMLGEGTRRALRVFMSDLAVEPVPDGLRVSFFLPKGVYATTVLGAVCRLQEARPGRPPEEPEEKAEPDDRTQR
jgi:tRNA pseudouridine13 synthase